MISGEERRVDSIMCPDAAVDSSYPPPFSMITDFVKALFDESDLDEDFFNPSPETNSTG